MASNFGFLRLTFRDKNDKMIAGYGTILMYVITARKWELGAISERAL